LLNSEHPDFDVCTGCGDTAFACVIGNGNLNDAYNGPYALCEAAHADWLIIGDTIVDLHD